MTGVVGSREFRLIMRMQDQTSRQLNTINKNLGSVRKQGKDSSASLSKSFANFGKILTGAAVLGALTKLKRGLDSLSDAAGVQEKAVSKVEAVLKSTGYAAGYSSVGIQKMASSLQEVTTYGDEAILNMQSMLLTFKGIQGEAFEKTTELALDLSAAFDQDLKSSAMQLGKALEDPATGLTALRRIGVSFTEQQKEMIQAMQEGGDIAGAQAEILKVLEGQVGGVARAMANTNFGIKDALQNEIGDIKEIAGKALEDALTPGRKAILDWIRENKQTITTIFENLPEVARLAGSTAAAVLRKAISWDGMKGTISAIGTGLFETLKNAILSLPKIFKSAFDLVTTPLRNFGEWVNSLFAGIWVKVRNGFIEKLKDLPVIGGLFEGIPIDNELAKGPEKFGELWDRTISEVQDKSKHLLDEYKDYAAEQLNTIKGVTTDVAGVFDEELKGFRDGMRAIIEKGAAAVPSVDGIPAVSSGSGVSGSGGTARGPWADFAKRMDTIGEQMGRLDLFPAEKQSELASAFRSELDIDELILNTGEVKLSREQIAIYESMIGTLDAIAKEDSKDKGDNPFEDILGSDFLQSLENLKAVLNPIQTIIDGIFSILGPAINRVLAPLAGMLNIIGQMIGSLLLPVLGPVQIAVEALGKVFVWLYNSIFVPVHNWMQKLFNKIYNGFAKFVNGIISLVNKIPFVDIGKIAIRDSDTYGMLDEIDYDTLAQNAPGSSGSGGSGASYAGGTSLTVNIEINTEVIAGDSGLRELALMLRNEIQMAEALGY